MLHMYFFSYAFAFVMILIKDLAFLVCSFIVNESLEFPFCETYPMVLSLQFCLFDHWQPMGAF